jgi:hypothetical protein
LEKVHQLMDSTDWQNNLGKVYNADFRKIIAASKDELIAMVDQRKFLELYYAQLVFHQIAQPERIEPVLQSHSFIQDHFSWCSCSDFRIAFEMNAAGKLNAKHNSFKSFDNMFIGNVLSDYKELRNDAMKKWNEINVNYVDASKQLAPSTESIDYLQDIFDKDIDYAKEGKFRSAYMLGTRMYDWLYSSNNATDESWSEEEWSSAKKQAKKNIADEQELTRTKMQRITSNERMHQLYKESVMNEMKKLLYVQFLKNKIK